MALQLQEPAAAWHLQRESKHTTISVFSSLNKECIDFSVFQSPLGSIVIIFVIQSLYQLSDGQD